MFIKKKSIKLARLTLLTAIVSSALVLSPFAQEAVTESVCDLVEEECSESAWAEDLVYTSDEITEESDELIDLIQDDDELPEQIVITLPDTYTLEIPGVQDPPPISMFSLRDNGSATFTGRFGDQLTENASHFYKEEVKHYITNRSVGNLKFTFDTSSSPYRYEATELGDNSSDAFQDMIGQLKLDMQASIDAFMYDEPSFFWSRLQSFGRISVSYVQDPSSASGYRGYITSLSFIPSEVFTNASSLVTTFDSNVSSVHTALETTGDRNGDGIVSDVEYIKAAHDYICKRMVYNNDAVNGDPMDYLASFTAGGAFLDEFGRSFVCEGYAKAFKVLCDKKGIPCVLISGYANGGAHMWNGVLLNGSWYMMDVTWDDGDPYTYNFFLTHRANGNHISSGDFSNSGGFSFSYPELSITAYNYCVGEHQWDSGREQGTTTCQQGSTTHYTCEICGETKYEENEKGSHTFDSDGRCSQCSIFENSSYNQMENASITVADQTYTGSPLTPPVTVKMGETLLKAEEDYSVSYKDNISAGVTTVTITGKGVIAGEKTATYTIKPAALSLVSFSPLSSQLYTGDALTPGIAGTYKGNDLTGDDFTVMYRNNTNAGIATASITGKGNFSGIRNLTFTIEPVPLTDDMISSVNSGTYSGTVYIPEITLSYLGKEIDSSYLTLNASAVNAGPASATITGKQNYTGTLSIPYTIYPRSIGETSIALESAGLYDGQIKCPNATVSYKESELKRDVDFTLSYKDNIYAGTAAATITGKGNFTGKKTVSFTIGKQPIGGAVISPISSYVCIGKAIKPTVTVYKDGKLLTLNADYAVSYTGNTYPGTARVTITGKGNYSGSLQTTFAIKHPSITLKRPVLGKLTSGSKKIYVRTNAASDADGFLISYGLKKSFSGAKTVQVKSSKALKKTIKSLKKNKTYYVRVRTYTTLYGKTYYSAWSKSKKIKTK